MLCSFFNCVSINAQLRITIPWSSSLNQTFGNGSVDPGPLAAGHTDFAYTTEDRPAAGFYNIIYSTNDAGHIFLGSTPMTKPTPGYKMIVCYDGYFTPKIVFSDTLRNLCGNYKYLFWAGINNVAPRNCLYPNLTFSVETISGVIIKSFETGNIGGPGDSAANYNGYTGPVPFYGGIFQLPAGGE